MKCFDTKFTTQQGERLNKKYRSNMHSNPAICQNIYIVDIYMIYTKSVWEKKKKMRNIYNNNEKNMRNNTIHEKNKKKRTSMRKYEINIE